MSNPNETPVSHINQDEIEKQRDVDAAYEGWLDAMLDKDMDAAFEGTAPVSAHKIMNSLIMLLGPDNVLEQEPMRKHTTFKVGGPVDVMVTPRTIEQIQGVLELCRLNEIPVRFLGLGSNVLVSDEGISCLVIKLADNFADIRVEGEQVICQAGASNEAIAAAALDAGLAGYEFASGIPGSIGGAAIMNAGAYDGEFKDVAISVDCLTPEGDLVTVSAADADWGYRHSMMMDKGWLVVGATIGLHAGDPAAIKARMDDLRARREEKQPLEMASAGSTFKRPEGYYAGKLIQDAGMQGHARGGAEVSRKHAGFVVNTGMATAADVRNVIADVQAAVKDQFGVDLQPEVRMWGFK